MGIKDGINVHLWYWLERSCSDNELKTWLSGYPADDHKFNPIQIDLACLKLALQYQPQLTHLI
jgi:hypothetical protein